MEPNKHRHLLADLWESYPDALSNNFQSEKSYGIVNHLSDLLAVGPYYHYVINIADYSVSQVSERTASIHGLASRPTTIKEIIDLIHPDDLEFVLKAEEATLFKMKEIGFEHQLFLKSSYCFRMRVANGSYHLFHHQAIHLAKDDSGRLASALNIHTDVQHITQINNRIVLVKGIGIRDDYCQIDLSQQKPKSNIPSFSKREMEIISLVAKGNSSSQIAEKLFISPDTVRTHRKNLFRKAETKRVGEFICKCIEWGLLQIAWLSNMDFFI
ncbi:LuxR C-terminal-related transcriptional regulator [Sphingobacterium spiritivorum]|uniref:LuxR C-terminal-related transcriptional regulator n=1 Tax=Sphingobacterium spiritivorum TaxID=258 RepID=UPI003DA6BA50